MPDVHTPHSLIQRRPQRTNEQSRAQSKRTLDQQNLHAAHHVSGNPVYSRAARQLHATAPTKMSFDRRSHASARAHLTLPLGEERGLTTICAHRGASRTCPENTRLAFDTALCVGADMLEFDIRRTRDGQCIVMHDATVDRTTNGHGAICDLTYDAIRQLDAGDGQQVPNLEEVMAYASHTMLNVEIKTAGKEDALAIAEALAPYFRDASVREAAFITAADQTLLRRLRELVPSVRVFNFVYRHDPAAAAREDPVSQVLQPQVRHVKAPMVAQAQALGLKGECVFC